MAAGPGETVFGVAAPPWAVEYDVRGEASGPRHRSTVPQHPARASIFDEIPAGPVTLDGGLVLCRANVTAGHPWDSRGVFGRHVDPDITYRISVDGELETARGEEDARSAVIALPGISLAPGASFSIRAEDRDVGRDDDMGTAELVFSGTSPFPGTGDGAGALQYECRAASREWAEQRAAQHFGVSDGPLATLDESHPNLDEGVVELPAAPVEPVREPLFRAAGLLGWGHPAVRQRLAIVDEAKARFADELATQVAAAQSRLPEPGAPVALADGSQARVREVGCDTARAEALATGRPCYLVLEVAAAGPQAQVAAPRVILVAGTGEPTVLTPDAAEVGGRTQRNTAFVPTGAPVGLIFGLDSAAVAPEPSPPVIVLSTPVGGAKPLRLY